MRVSRTSGLHRIIFVLIAAVVEANVRAQETVRSEGSGETATKMVVSAAITDSINAAEQPVRAAPKRGIFATRSVAPVTVLDVRWICPILGTSLVIPLIAAFILTVNDNSFPVRASPGALWLVTAVVAQMK